AYASIKKKLETKLKSALSATRKAAVELRKALSDANVSPEETQRYLFNHIDKILTFKFNEGRKSKRLFKPLDLSKKSVFKKGKERPGTEHLTQLALTMYDRYDDWLKTLAAPEIILWECYAPLLPYLGLLGEVRSKMNSFLETNNMIQLGETNSMLRQIIGEDDTPFIYERLGSVINHYLIDEFQDTSRMQWDNLYPLLKENDSRGEDNLIIGDAKQSIYRFRNADPSLISTVVPELFPRHLAAGSGRSDNTNWRSARRIVEFNNLFFRFLVGRLEKLKSGSIDFKNLYENVAQYASKRKNSGYVEVRFLNPADDEKRKEEGKSPADIASEMAVEAVGPLISSIINRGIDQRDIAILVDTNNAGKAVIGALVDYNATLAPEERKIDFISEESLLVSQAESVQIIVNVLSQITDGYDTIGKDESDTDEHRDVKWNKIKAALDFYTLRHPELSVAEQVAGFLNEESRDNVIAEMLAEMQSVALPALVEAITERFVPVEMRRAQAVFIAGFQDMVLDYTERYPAEVASFLSWWV
ncbi:MAG: UvrD-helicase domain-containing protein, partial [Muribaculaceae bacterium]|nr:UvrD-helicase domain-containing protein [Muribaculaceae bacterium]